MSKGKILIVDDEHSFAEFAKMILETEGYEALHCADGHKALEEAVAAKPRLIILDMWMPEITGNEVIAQLKSDPATKDIPVILCSITKSRREVGQAFELGAIDYVPKPIKSEMLMASVHKALGEPPAGSDR